jgi:hypothetical protein
MNPGLFMSTPSVRVTPSWLMALPSSWEEKRYVDYIKRKELTYSNFALTFFWVLGFSLDCFVIENSSNVVSLKIMYDILLVLQAGIGYMSWLQEGRDRIRLFDLEVGVRMSQNCVVLDVPGVCLGRSRVQA